MELLSSILNYGLAHGNLLNCLVENKSIPICQGLNQFINTSAVADFCGRMLNSNSRNAGSSQESKMHKSFKSYSVIEIGLYQAPFTLSTVGCSQGQE